MNFNPHARELDAEGTFLPDGRSVPLPPVPEELLGEGCRQRGLDFLARERVLGWRHSRFSAHSASLRSGPRRPDNSFGSPAYKDEWLGRNFAACQTEAFVSNRNSILDTSAVLTQKLADGGINLRGFSASVIGTQFVVYVAVDSLNDADKAIEILEKA